MSKKKSPPSRSKRSMGKLAEADKLIADGEFEEAQRILEIFTRNNPTHVDALNMLSYVYNQQRNLERLFWITEQLVRLDPTDERHLYNIVGICVPQGIVFTAQHYAAQFLEKWPDSALIEDIQKTKESLDQVCVEIMASPMAPPGATTDDLMLSELITLTTQMGELKRAEALSRQAIERMPDFAPPYNNLCMVYLMMGDFEQAAEIARYTLEQHPDNVFALSNMVQLHVRLGQTEQARQAAERLLAVSSTEETDIIKQMEGLAWLGDDQALSDLYQRHEQVVKNFANPNGYHLAAVAFARLGDENRAKQLWQQALKRIPSFSVARENLNDLRDPVGERNGAWAFSFAQWIPTTWIEGLVRNTQHSRNLKRDLERLFAQYPAFATALPILLERGDPQGRELALMVATQAELPILRDYALSPYGPDMRRMEAAQVAIRLGLLPRGKTQLMYSRGVQTELMPISYGIHERSSPERIPKPAEKLMQQAHAALTNGQVAEAEQLAKRVLEIVPDHAPALNYLQTAYTLGERQQEADETARYLAERHPDYLFGRCAMAALCVREKRFGEAHQWLDPMLQRAEFHYSEFAVLAITQIDLSLAEGQRDSALNWFQVWEQVMPKHPAIAPMRKKVGLGLPKPDFKI